MCVCLFECVYVCVCVCGVCDKKCACTVAGPTTKVASAYDQLVFTIMLTITPDRTIVGMARTVHAHTPCMAVSMLISLLTIWHKHHKKSLAIWPASHIGRPEQNVGPAAKPIVAISCCAEFDIVPYVQLAVIVSNARHLQ
jgi:hypothetical protein